MSREGPQNTKYISANIFSSQAEYVVASHFEIIWLKFVDAVTLKVRAELKFQQEGALCAQHCLNALLQGPYYTAVDLATLAQQLDEEERRRMAEGLAGADDPEYQRFLAQPSANMDDTGFFSLQVLSKAIEVWGLELINLNSSDATAVMARRDPISQYAYICNYREHWFTIRRLGRQWFDLNSLLKDAALITDTYLHMFLTQLQTEGYSIYVVVGNLPDCPADQILMHEPAVQIERPRLMSADEVRGKRASSPTGGATALPIAGDDDAAALRQAMALSLAQSLAQGQPGAMAAGSSTEDEDLRLAIQLSQSMGSAPSSFGRHGRSREDPVNDQSHVLSEEDDIQRAIQMSLQSSQADRDTKKASKQADRPLPPPAATAVRKSSDLKRDVSAVPPRATRTSAAATATSPTSRSFVSPSAPKSSRTRLGSGDIGSNIVGLHDSPKSPEAPPAAVAQHRSPISPSQLPSMRPMAPPPTFATRSPPFTSSPTTRSQFGQVDMSTTVAGGERLGGPAAAGGRVGLRQSTPDPEEVRQRRLAFLDKMATKKDES